VSDPKRSVLAVFVVLAVFALMGCAPQHHDWTAAEVFDHLQGQGLEVTNASADVSNLPSAIGTDVQTDCRERMVFQIQDTVDNQIFVCDRVEDIGEISLYFLQSVEPVPDLITNSNAPVMLVLSPDLNLETRRLYDVALATLGMRYIYD
jgi:hypothetical protein